MALRLRRGTNAERQLITPLEGEPIFTTDTKDLYIGDGSTAGGIKVGGDIPTSINDLTDVNTSGIGVGQVLKWNGTQFVAGDDNNDGTGTGTGIVEGQTYNIGITGNDSSLIVDANTNTFRGVFEGVAYVDLIGSVFSDNDSSLILDGTNRLLNVNDIELGTLNPTITASNNITITAPGGVSIDGIAINPGSQIEPENDNEGFVGSFARRFAEGHFLELTAEDIIGNFRGTFSGDDSSILIDGITGEHFGTFRGNLLGNVIGNVDGNLSGTVRGNLIGDVKGSLFGDDSTVIIDSINNLITGNISTNSIESNNLGIDANTVVISNTGTSLLFLDNNQPTVDLYAGADLHGLLIFRTTDINGVKNSGLIGTSGTGLTIAKADAALTLPDSHKIHIGTDGNFGFGTLSPTEKFDFIGNGRFSGILDAASFRGSVVADDSTLLVDAVNGTIPGYISIADLKTALQDGAGDYAAFKAWVLANL